MKKLLSLLSAISLTTIITSNITSCYSEKVKSFVKTKQTKNN